ncbi:MAG TPA: SDR family NAD(P)-dependent oxidoreductase [Myxococcales bacterium]|nr:SDR family NAD(P)-dependent oxidoreductase [Myxococcales bacterium]
MTATDVFSVKGKGCLVTGAAMGIGFGIARRLVRSGANVLLVDKDEQALARAAQELAGGAGSARTFGADVADEAAAPDAVARCVEHFRSLDVLVNNAGIYPQVPAMKMPVEQFDQVLRVNLRSAFLFSKAAATRMIAQGGGGRIVNIASVDSFHPSMVGLAAYDASKGGLRMLTESLALELAPHGILVNAIAPGGITTEGTQRPLTGSGMNEAQMKAMVQQMIDAKIPLKRMGEPDDIATVALFLASDASRYMTGSTVVVDGGMLLS